MSRRYSKVNRTNIVITDEMLKALCAGTSSPKILIKQILLIKGMMQKDLAKDMGKNPGFIYVLLNNECSLGSQVLYEICVALGLNPAIVFQKWAEWMLEKEKKRHPNKGDK